MPMRFVSDVAAYLRRLLDEPDATYLSPTDLVTLLEAGYADFRSRVTDIDPRYFEISADLTVAADSYDLAAAGSAVRLMGATPTAERLLRLNEVWALPAAGGVPRARIDVVGRITELTAVAERIRVILHGTVLQFSAAPTAVRLYYVGTGSQEGASAWGVDWTLTASTDSEWIDELVMFHDVIALLASLHFDAFRKESIPEREALLQTRLAALEQHLQFGRAPGAIGHVIEEWDA